MQISFGSSWDYLLSHLLCLPDNVKEPLFSWEMQSDFRYLFSQPLPSVILCCFLFIIIFIGHGKYRENWDEISVPTVLFDLNGSICRTEGPMPQHHWKETQNKDNLMVLNTIHSRVYELTQTLSHSDVGEQRWTVTDHFILWHVSGWGGCMQCCPVAGLNKLD